MSGSDPAFREGDLVQYAGAQKRGGPDPGQRGRISTKDEPDEWVVAWETEGASDPRIRMSVHPESELVLIERPPASDSEST